MYVGITDFFKSAGKKVEGVKDPVCGMNVDMGTTQYKSTYQGKEYGFCSEQCKKTFDENLSQFS